MKVIGVVCKKCKEFIYSRTLHDYHSCKCGAVFIDGGQRDYVKISGDYNSFETKHVEINATERDLLEDYVKCNEKFGVLKQGEY